MDRKVLNQKAWYRALKVFFIFSFLISQAMGMGIAYSLSDDRVSFIRCDNGKEFENDSYYLSDKEKLDIFKKCDLASFLLQKTEVKGRLTDAQMEEIRIQVSRMQADGALQSEMQQVVDDYKQKYADRNPSDMGETYTVEELSKIYGHDFNDSFKVEGEGYWVSNFTIQYKEKYSLFQKIGFYILFVVAVSALFWIISRIFFYISTGEQFIKIHK